MRGDRRCSFWLALLSLVITLGAAACGGDDSRSSDAATSRSSDAAAPAPASSIASTDGWAEIARAAEGQTVRFWMWGGDDRVNAYIDELVRPAAQQRGIDVERVPIDDTADAVQRVVAEFRAGEENGAVDLVWINGENFAAGKEAGLWLSDWVADLPNAQYVNLGDPSIALDFQVPTDGQEAPWSRAAFIFAFDAERVSDPPTTFEALLEWARANPGRFTYPAPPDFTGSAFVRSVIQHVGTRDAAWALLRELRPLQHRSGDAFPESEAELNELFANGEVDFSMSYDPGFVQGAVSRGQFPETARPLLIGGGALVNTSYVAIPRNAKNAEAAQVLADVLLDPTLQAAKADPDTLGLPTVLELDRLTESQRAAFDASTESEYLLDDFGEVVPELAASEVGPIEESWIAEVLR